MWKCEARTSHVAHGSAAGPSTLDQCSLTLTLCAWPAYHLWQICSESRGAESPAPNRPNSEKEKAIAASVLRAGGRGRAGALSRWTLAPWRVCRLAHATRIRAPATTHPAHPAPLPHCARAHTHQTQHTHTATHTATPHARARSRSRVFLSHHRRAGHVQAPAAGRAQTNRRSADLSTRLALVSLPRDSALPRGLSPLSKTYPWTIIHHRDRIYHRAQMSHVSLLGHHHLAAGANQLSVAALNASIVVATKHTAAIIVASPRSFARRRHSTSHRPPCRRRHGQQPTASSGESTPAAPGCRTPPPHRTSTSQTRPPGTQARDTGRTSRSAPWAG